MAGGAATGIGRRPKRDALDLDGLVMPDADLDLLLSVDTEVWKQEAGLIPEFFAQFGDHLPKALTEEHAALVERLAKS